MTGNDDDLFRVLTAFNIRDHVRAFAKGFIDGSPQHEGSRNRCKDREDGSDEKRNPCVARAVPAVEGAVLQAASLLLGNVMALRQDDSTRLLAWSTVSQAGWVVLPVAALSAQGLRASAAYVTGAWLPVDGGFALSTLTLGFVLLCAIVVADLARPPDGRCSRCQVR